MMFINNQVCDFKIFNTETGKIMAEADLITVNGTVNRENKFVGFKVDRKVSIPPCSSFEIESKR